VPYVSGAGAPVIDGAFVTVTDEPDEPDEATATLSVADQQGDGETLTVDEANASVPYAITASYDGETTESDRFAAGEAVSNLSLELEPPLESNATVDVSVVDENGTALANDSLEYTVANDTGENDTDEPEASLSVDNQTGDGETLTVDAASASVPYVLAAEYDGERVESDEIEANATVSDEILELEPPLAENTTVDVSVHAAADDAVLANDSIEYAVEVPDPDAPTANLSVADQTGDGETLIVTQANASVEYAITVADGNGTRLATSETFGANETIGPEEFDLEPPLAENTTLEVAVVAADDGTPIETADVDYTVDGAPAGFDVEFVNCQRAEVTASLEEGDRVAASTWFYASGGVGDTIAEDLVTAGDEIPAPYNGTIVFEIGTERNVTMDGEQVIVEVPDYGTFGTYISGISSPEAPPLAVSTIRTRPRRAMRKCALNCRRSRSRRRPPPRTALTSRSVTRTRTMPRWPRTAGSSRGTRPTSRRPDSNRASRRSPSSGCRERRRTARLGGRLLELRLRGAENRRDADRR